MANDAEHFTAKTYTPGAKTRYMYENKTDIPDPNTNNNDNNNNNNIFAPRWRKDIKATTIHDANYNPPNFETEQLQKYNNEGFTNKAQKRVHFEPTTTKLPDPNDE
jgi:hypothetical protein